MYAAISAKFPLDDLELLEEGTFVGCQYHECEQGIVADQRKLLSTILLRFTVELEQRGLKYALRRRDVPGVDTDTIALSEGDELEGHFTTSAARHVMALLYVARHTRPDISASVNALARHFQAWSRLDDKQLARLMSYLQETVDWVLLLSAQDPAASTYNLYVDADFAGDRHSRKSTSGYVFGLETKSSERPAGAGPEWSGFCPLAWGSVTQKGVSLSTAEAELRALVEGARKFFGSEALMIFLGAETLLKHGTIFCDSQACLALVRKGRSSKMGYVTSTRKALHIQLQWARENCLAQLEHVASADNVADIFTKYLPAEEHIKHCKRLGLYRASTVLWWEDTAKEASV